MIISTGMANFKEIDSAIKVIKSFIKDNYYAFHLDNTKLFNIRFITKLQKIQKFDRTFRSHKR